MGRMVWRDININKVFSHSKSFYCITFVIPLFMIYGAINSFIIHSTLEDKIMTFLVVLAFTYYGAYNLFIILKGGRYVKLIQKAGEQFVLVNIFNEEIVFKLSDVSSVKHSKYSRFETLLTDFGGKNPGFCLFLKNGRKYRITSDMENINTLREHLLGIAEN